MDQMKLCMEVGLSPVHTVLDGDAAPLPKKGSTAAPNFWPMYCGQTGGWIKMPLGTEVGLRTGDILGPGDIVLDEDPAPPKRGTAIAHFSTMSIVAKRLDGSRCHLVRR